MMITNKRLLSRYMTGDQRLTILVPRALSLVGGCSRTEQEVVGEPVKVVVGKARGQDDLQQNQNITGFGFVRVTERMTWE